MDRKTFSKCYNNLLADDIAYIRQMPDAQQEFLYGSCDKWAKDHFNSGCQIKSIVLWIHTHSGRLIHCFLRNTKTKKYIDVRGEYNTVNEILRYTGVDIRHDDAVELYSFTSIKDFDRFISWLEFENKRCRYLSNGVCEEL